MLNVKTNVNEETIISVDDGLLKVELAYIGEGFTGDYDSNDPDDEPLLRFYTYVNSNHGTKEEPFWEEVRDGSYCTSVSKNSEIAHIAEVAKTILIEFRKIITCYDEKEGIPSIKKTAEKMSHIS